ncbi:family 31 glycosyltransferase [Coniochaeta ligniaria NRRL 30616]|uniref:N-acetylgalactosaminide beta-1,3-galactosyltransferase n=1 Tax=Coniochaeta ligniaria NRRL 30616 TaxID=1408157 RepID=A0A1J7J7I4_9PEZI|nr:family 31 glycosyltransferase [Coniochaeta ligniaria NRRL 30616]
MRWPRPGRMRRLVSVTALCLLVWAILCWTFLPYDSPAVLWLRFVGTRFVSLFRAPVSAKDWLSIEPRFPVDLDVDVAFIAKTGYGTHGRLLAQLDALGLVVDGDTAGNTVIIADFAAELQHNGHKVVVHDVLAPLARDKTLAGEKGYERIVKYNDMTEAIRSGRSEEAKAATKSFGWELDALKFIPGMDLAYQRMPDKKWYIMVDDDTYLVQGSLRAMLDRLDPSVPAYLGNGVGDFKGRFAHGGSAVIISGAAMSLLFDQNRDLLPAAYVSSLSETWGDKLVATTFQKMGVYLDERFSHFFNGESPSITRIRADRLCSPIISFHGLARPEQMAEVGNQFRHVRGLVTWGHLWKLYGRPDMEEYITNPIRPDHDHVGRPDEATMDIFDVGSAERCLASCNGHYKTCLAWTWDSTNNVCHLSPWIIIGEVSPGKFSGINAARVQRLAGQCTNAK